MGRNPEKCKHSNDAASADEQESSLTVSIVRPNVCTATAGVWSVLER